MVGVSTKRLVRLSLSVGRGSTQSAGLVDLRHAGSGAPHDALDVDELEGNDRKLPWMDLVGPPGETIEDFYDWIRTSLLRWYGWDRHTRFIAFDSLRLSSRQFDGEQCDFTGPAFESARVYLQLCCFVAANCCKRLEGNKAFTYEIPEFDPQTLFVITGTVATPMPDRNPLSWPIERVARFGDKLTVLEEAARTYRQVIFVAPEANRSEVESSIQGLGSVGRAKVEPVYVETFSEVLNALGFRRRDTRFDSQEALHEFHASLDDIHKTLTDWSKPTYVERVHALAQLANGASRFLDTAELVSGTGDLDQPKPEFDQDDRVMTDVALSSSNLIFSLLDDIDDKEISRKSEHKLYEVRGVRLLADILDALPVERDQVPLIQRVLRFIDPTDSSITVSHWMKPLAVTVERTIVRAWYCNDRNTAERQLVRLREIIEQWISSCYDGNPKGGDPDEFRNELFRRVRAVARDPHLVARFTGVLPDR